MLRVLESDFNEVVGIRYLSVQWLIILLVNLMLCISAHQIMSTSFDSIHPVLLQLVPVAFCRILFAGKCQRYFEVFPYFFGLVYR